MTPKHKTTYSAGADLTASESVTIEPMQTRLVGTGFSLCEIKTPRPASYHEIVYMLHVRSSIAYKRGLILTNGVGVIDSDYKDEIKVMLTNLSDKPQTVIAGERIAQLVPMRYQPFIFECEENDRVGGFGSTGE